MSLNSYLSTMNTAPATFLETEGKPKLSLMDGSCQGAQKLLNCRSHFCDLHVFRYFIIKPRIYFKGIRCASIFR